MKFPLVAVKGSGIELKKDLEALRFCTKRALRPGGWFDGGGPRLFDAGGVEYRIRSIGNARRTGRKAFPGWFAPVLFEVDVDLEMVGPCGVGDLRAALVSAIEAAPEIWNSATGSLEPTLSGLRRARSVVELWDVMLPLITPA